MSVDKERYAQVVSTLGGAILGSRGNPTQDILTPSDRWRDLPQYLEYRAAKEVLSLVFSFLLLCPFYLPFLQAQGGQREGDDRYASRHGGAQGYLVVLKAPQC
jgi:hypothetical protein